MCGLRVLQCTRRSCGYSGMHADRRGSRLELQPASRKKAAGRLSYCLPSLEVHGDVRRTSLLGTSRRKGVSPPPRSDCSMRCGLLSNQLSSDHMTVSLFPDVNSVVAMSSARKVIKERGFAKESIPSDTCPSMTADTCTGLEI